MIRLLVVAMRSLKVFLPCEDSLLLMLTSVWFVKMRKVTVRQAIGLAIDRHYVRGNTGGGACPSTAVVAQIAQCVQV